MSTINVIDLKNHPITVTILNSGLAADADLDFSAYMPKIDLERAEPIIWMALDDTTDGATTARIEYTPNDRVAAAASLATGKYFITDEDTINIGDATNVGGHTYRLTICYWPNRTLNN